jgi:hypothetical protein
MRIKSRKRIRSKMKSKRTTADFAARHPTLHLDLTLLLLPYGARSFRRTAEPG